MAQIQLTPPDTDGDGSVTISDLNRVTSNWMSTTNNGAASGDVNDDGIVNQADLDIVLADWQDSGPAHAHGGGR